MRKLAFLIITAILLTTTAHSFETNLETLEGTTNSSSPAEYRLHISNPENVDRRFSISIVSPKQSWIYSPGTVKIPGRSNISEKITVNPSKNALRQRYKFDGKVRNTNTDKIKQFTGFFQVEDRFKLQVKSLEKNKEDVKPGERFNMSITIQNLDGDPVEDYKVTAEYLNHTRNETGTKILSRGTRKYTQTFETRKNMSPQTLQVKYTVEAEGKIQAQTNNTVKIQKVRELKKEATETFNILTKNKRTQVQNLGNTNANTKINITVPSYLKSITNPKPQPDSTKNSQNQITYIWNVHQLSPRQKKTFETETSYWVPITAIILLTTGITAIKLLGKDVKLSKTVEEKNGKIKVNIEAENRGSRTFNRLKLKEYIPDIATVEENFDMNTPKIRKTNDGTKLTWTVENLEPGDTRIIQYQIQPKVEVDGKVKLEKATLENTEGNKIAESNSPETNFNP